MADQDLVIYTAKDRVARITMNRPDKRNALSFEMVAELKRALRRASDDPSVRVVVLTGNGSAFSAGADLAALQRLQDASAEENLRDSTHLAELFRDIYLHRCPVIARINGHAIAGGCGLAAVCDFSIANERAKFGFTEVRIGFVPAIVSVFLLRKLGEGVAKNLLLRGALLSAEEAAVVGLITRAVPNGELDDAVHDLAQELASETSGSAVAMTKELLASIPSMGLDEALASAAQANALARSTADCREGVAAFLEKRDPPWKSASGETGGDA